MKRLATLEAKGQKKSKKMRLPNKAKVRRSKIKKGWTGVLRVDENGNMSGEKQRVEGSAFKTTDESYHATDGHEILFWNGKFPIIIQETKTKNPKLFNEGENETYGQKYIMALMLKDTIKDKKKGGKGILIWIAIAAVIYIVGKYVLKLF